MGGVSSADRSPGGASTRTVEEPTTATRICDLSTDTRPEVASSQKPEIARRPAVSLLNNRLPWRPTHKFGQADEFCFRLYLNGLKAPTIDRQQQSILHSTPEPEIEILMTSSKCRQRTSRPKTAPIATISCTRRYRGKIYTSILVTVTLSVCSSSRLYSGHKCE